MVVYIIVLIFLSSLVDLCQDNQRKRHKHLFDSIKYHVYRSFWHSCVLTESSCFPGNQNDIRIGEENDDAPR